MENKIKQYLDSLVCTDIIIYKLGGNAADQIYCVDFYSNPSWKICTNKEPARPITSILVSAWDKDEDWKFKLRDAYMQSLVYATSDPQILIDRYKSNLEDDD